MPLAWYEPVIGFWTLFGFQELSVEDEASLSLDISASIQDLRPTARKRLRLRTPRMKHQTTTEHNDDDSDDRLHPIRVLATEPEL